MNISVSFIVISWTGSLIELKIIKIRKEIRLEETQRYRKKKKEKKRKEKKRKKEREEERKKEKLQKYKYEKQKGHGLTQKEKRPWPTVIKIKRPSHCRPIDRNGRG